MKTMNEKGGKNRPKWIAISGLRTKLIVSLTLVDDPCVCVYLGFVERISRYHFRYLSSFGRLLQYLRMSLCQLGLETQVEITTKMMKGPQRKYQSSNQQMNERMREKKCLLCVEFVCVFFSSAFCFSILAVHTVWAKSY